MKKYNFGKVWIEITHSIFLKIEKYLHHKRNIHKLLNDSLSDKRKNFLYKKTRIQVFSDDIS